MTTSMRGRSYANALMNKPIVTYPNKKQKIIKKSGNRIPPYQACTELPRRKL